MHAQRVAKTVGTKRPLVGLFVPSVCGSAKGFDRKAIGPAPSAKRTPASALFNALFGAALLDPPSVLLSFALLAGLFIRLLERHLFTFLATSRRKTLLFATLFFLALSVFRVPTFRVCALSQFRLATLRFCTLSLFRVATFSFCALSLFRLATLRFCTLSLFRLTTIALALSLFCVATFGFCALSLFRGATFSFCALGSFRLATFGFCTLSLFRLTTVGLALSLFRVATISLTLRLFTVATFRFGALSLFRPATLGFCPLSLFCVATFGLALRLFLVTTFRFCTLGLFRLASLRFYTLSLFRLTSISLALRLTTFRLGSPALLRLTTIGLVLSLFRVATFSLALSLFRAAPLLLAFIRLTLPTPLRLSALRLFLVLPNLEPQRLLGLALLPPPLITPAARLARDAHAAAEPTPQRPLTPARRPRQRRPPIPRVMHLAANAPLTLDEDVGVSFEVLIGHVVIGVARIEDLAGGVGVGLHLDDLKPRLDHHRLQLEVRATRAQQQRAQHPHGRICSSHDPSDGPRPPAHSARK